MLQLLKNLKESTDENKKWFMKKLAWNLGIMVIRLGYWVRNCDDPSPNQLPDNFRWWVGVVIVRVGYNLRGDIPRRTWRWNHV